MKSIIRLVKVTTVNGRIYFTDIRITKAYDHTRFHSRMTAAQAGDELNRQQRKG